MPLQDSFRVKQLCKSVVRFAHLSMRGGSGIDLLLFCAIYSYRYLARQTPSIRTPLHAAFFVVVDSFSIPMQHFLRCSVLETLHRPAVQLRLQFLNQSLCIVGYIASLGDIPSYHPIRVFNRALLPGVILMAEIYLDIQKLFQLLVSLEEEIIVGGHGLHLGESLFDSEKCPVHIFNRDMKNLLNK